ncbi:OmpA family protein [Candidatus Haliotispira prima]|uniref:OmpA family protein n=1 Tax=Candidatus Haliotispira prima TaxID=3034016 RepID=A0ABY8ME67_9SPIO|nr:OmpA family protein [Candidatus Haliotispira prima]
MPFMRLYRRARHILWRSLSAFAVRGSLLLIGFVGLGLAALAAQTKGPAVRFVYKHYDGQQYHIVAQVNEQVYRNNKLVYNTLILNRIAVKVVEMAGQNGQDALLDVNYQVSEEAENGKFFSWAEENQARFGISPLGIYKNLAADGSLPGLRDVPSFPDRELHPGDGWSAPGSEVQDLSEVFGVPVRLHFDFTVNYLYRGKELRRGRKLEHITVVYDYSEDVSKQLPASLRLRHSNSPGSSGRSFGRGRQQEQETGDIPRSVRARHNIELYWDSERGLPVYQEENFEVSYLMQNGQEVKFKGRSRGNIIEAEPMKHEDIKQELEKNLKDAGIAADVEQNDKGILISIDSINFYPDSERMLPGEDRKLKHISRILQKYADRDILVTGHTANVGRPDRQQTLSESRAAVVGQFFIRDGVRSREQIVIRGVGGTQPIAPNTNESGRKQNRRVEIILLEN